MNGQNLLIGLSHIDRKFIEESENDTIGTKNSTLKEPTQGRKIFRKPLLIAAIVALMLFLLALSWCFLPSSLSASWHGHNSPTLSPKILMQPPCMNDYWKE